ncbi:MAG: hypothetical protein ACK2UW_16885 [Anaerolineales bacterium]
MPPDPDPVWLIFRRRTISRVVYVLRLLGIDLRDRSSANRLYIFYFVVFWLVWVVAGFSLLGSTAAGFFELLPGISPAGTAAIIGAFLLAAWGLYELWRVTARSPFVFGEADAYLLCQAPVRRRRVGLAWFLMDWFVTVLPFAAVAVLFSFALLDLALADVVSFLSLPVYFAASLRALVVVLPLQMGLQSGLYGLGAMRLRRDRPPNSWSWLRVVALLLAFGLLAAFFFPVWRAVILAPLLLPLQAAFGGAYLPAAWLARAVVAWLILCGGLLVLLTWSHRMHLGRAAQETRLESALRQARSTMDFELAGTLQRQEKMKITRSPSRLPVRGGVWMLVWKNLVQSSRTLRVSQLLRWGFVFLFFSAAWLSSGWVVQLIMGILWAVSLGSLATEPLRRDLARWWLLRSLPFQNDRMLAALLVPPWGTGVLSGWLALILIRPVNGWLIAALLPFLAACAVLGTAYSILEHAQARLLMTPAWAEENVPRQDVQGVITILITVGLPLAMLLWDLSQPGVLFWGLLTLPAAILITTILSQLVLRAYRWMA